MPETAAGVVGRSQGFFDRALSAHTSEKLML